MSMLGPTPMSRRERMSVAEEIADRALQAHGADLKAVGLYGSMARNDDGPFSDIEMFCVLRTPGREFSHEWSYGSGKAEVDFYGEDVLLHKAAMVDGRWPLTHGAFHAVLALLDPEGFFPKLRDVASARTGDQFRVAIQETLIGELYEDIGKVRNTPHKGTLSFLPELAMQMAKHTAFTIGLHHRRFFSSGSRVLEEALAMPDRPAGFDALCRLVMTGDLSSSIAVTRACEDCWAGVGTWAAAHGYSVNETRRIPF